MDDSFRQAYAKLNPAQREAVDYIDGPLLVIAGPGTGKTQLLALRAANILKQTDANPENILCVTFTDNATTNMRERLTRFIGDAAQKVHITTYHSLGAYILNTFQTESSPRTALDELGIFQLTRDLVNKLPSTSLLRRGNTISDIMSAIKDLKEADLTPADLRLILKDLQETNADLLPVLQPILAEIKGKRFKAALPLYTKIQNIIEKSQAKKPEFLIKNIEPISRVYYRELLHALLDAEENSNTKALGKWRDLFFCKDLQDRYVFNDYVKTHKLKDLTRVFDAYQQALQHQGLFDYSDMILQAIQLIKSDLTVRFNLSERFQYVLLDEFQDTNRAQAELINLIVTNPNLTDSPNLMAVGDDDQAIYAFQGANSSNFFDFDESYHPHKIVLTENYRSSKAILDFAKNVIDQADNRFSTSPNVKLDKNLTAANPPAKTAIRLSAFLSATAEYSALANKINKLIQSGAKARDIAVIAPKHQYLLDALPYLKRAGIPLSYERRDNILDNPDILGLLNACRLVLALTSKKPNLAEPLWFSVLALPGLNFSPADIVKLNLAAFDQRQNIFTTLTQTKNNAKFLATANFFADLATKTTTFPASAILRELSLKLFPPTSQDARLFLFYSHLNTLKDKLLAGQSDLSLAAFLAQIDAYLEAKDEQRIIIQDQSPYYSQQDAVRLFSVHAAKGLEFEHVFLISADDNAWARISNQSHLFLPMNLRPIHHGNDDPNEKIRVFFVAITRARSHLYLSYHKQNFAGKNKPELSYLQLETVSDDTKISHVLPPPFQTVQASDQAGVPLEDLSPTLWRATYLSKDLVSLMSPRLEHFRLSPTGLSTFLDLHYGEGPITFLFQYVFRIPSPSSPDLIYGNLIHAALDRMNKEQLKKADTLAVFMQELAKSPLTSSERQDLADRAKLQFEPFLDARGAALLASSTQSELNFFNQKILFHQAALTGKIDRVEIDTAHKTITLADFKTGRPKTRWDNNSFFYKLQLYFYKFLLENSHLFPDYQITTGRIDFTQPDQFGNFAPLKLTFNPKEEAMFAKLVQVVFKLIINCDFPDLSDLPLGSATATQSFVKKLLEA